MAVLIFLALQKFYGPLFYSQKRKVELKKLLFAEHLHYKTSGRDRQEERKIKIVAKPE